MSVKSFHFFLGHFHLSNGTPSQFLSFPDISGVSFTIFEKILPYPGLLLAFKRLRPLLVHHHQGLLQTKIFDVSLNAGQILFLIQELLRLVFSYRKLIEAV